MPIWMQAGCWGGFAGGALLVGAVIGYRMSLPKRIIAGMTLEAHPVVIDVYVCSTRLVGNIMTCRKGGSIICVARIYRSGTRIYRPTAVQLAMVKGYHFQPVEAGIVVGMTCNAAKLTRCYTGINNSGSITMTVITASELGRIRGMMEGDLGFLVGNSAVAICTIPWLA